MLGRATGSVWRLGFARVAVIATICAALGINASANASIRRHHWQAANTVLRLTDPEKDAALIVDGETGRALYARNAEALRHPASLTKMMTLYMLFEQLKSGQMTLATPIYVSGHAAMQSPTKLHVRPGTTIPVDTAIRAIVVLSANDVAVAVAEAIGGTEEHFAELMTAKARQMGMTHTYYHNASGLPDALQITSANDLALLARHLAYDFPQYFHYFSTYSFTYRGATIFTHDNLIGRYEGADGIKTGYTGASGFNLVSSVVRNGVHIIGVVMGGVTARRRDAEMMRLLNDTFAAISRNPQLVARADVPWQVMAENTPAKPVIAGFQLGGAAPQTPAANAGLPASPLRVAAPASTNDDEDAAESRPDPDFEAQANAPATPPAKVPAIPSATPPIVTAALTAPPPAQIAPAHSVEPPHAMPVSMPVASPHSVEPSQAAPASAPIVARGDIPLPEPKPHMMLAAFEPSSSQAGQAAKPKPRETAAGHQQVATLAPGPAPVHPAEALARTGDWTIQIGAFADEASAKAELAAYAGRSMDVLGQATRIVAPFQSVEGHVLYRARFGPFAEREARQVCQVLTQRGQTCFAAIAPRQ